MNSRVVSHRSTLADAVYGLLNPLPFGLFVAATIFDVIYVRTADVLWNKGAAWLIVFGLLIAVIPRFINLWQVWISSRHNARRADELDFWLNLIAVVVAIFNAFVHSRDAYAVVPAGVWLSACTVILLSMAHILMAVQQSTARMADHE